VKGEGRNGNLKRKKSKTGKITHEKLFWLSFKKNITGTASPRQVSGKVGK
jgi:hypothetical protein